MIRKVEVQEASGGRYPHVSLEFMMDMKKITLSSILRRYTIKPSL